MIADNNTRKARIIRAVDGDSAIVEIVTLDAGKFKDKLEYEIRFTICNTPERGQEGYSEAKAFTGQFVDQEVILVIHGTEKWGRILADVYVQYEGKQENLSSLLLQKGLAKVYGT
jgi:endonuclease YncB( thermonuclease family)